MAKIGGSDLRDDKDYLMRRMGEMRTEYNTFEPHYMDLSKFFDPRRGRFRIDDRNDGQKRHKDILNNHATTALRKATAGLLAGALSPSRPWFKFGLMDKQLERKPAVKAYLQRLRDLVLEVFNESNFYNMAPLMLRELLLFGTGCMTHEDDFDDVARFYTHTAGSYYIMTNSKGNVDTLARRFQLTCYQMVQRYGYKNCSVQVQNQWDRGSYGSWHSVYNFIELNPFRDETESRFSSEFMQWRSVFWEPSTGKGEDRNKFLKREGHNMFPAYCPRWETTNEDIYGTNCPGMTALGDVKQLQVQEIEKGKAIQKMVTPPLQGPGALRSQPIANLPGGFTVNPSSNQKIESMYNVDPRVRELLFDIEQTEVRIDDGLFVNLFMAITDQQGIQPKNELQLTQMDSERLLQLGPVMEQIHGEWLEKAVDDTAERLIKAGVPGEPPPEMDGQQTKIKFTSAIAQAQRSVAAGNIERTLGFAGSLTEMGFEMNDKVDADFALDEYADIVGAPASLIRSTDEANEARKARQEQMEQQQMLEQAQQAANVAKMAGDTKLDDDNLAARVANGG